MRAVDVPLDLGFEQIHIHFISYLNEPADEFFVAVDGGDEPVLVVDVHRI